MLKVILILILVNAIGFSILLAPVFTTDCRDSLDFDSSPLFANGCDHCGAMGHCFESGDGECRLLPETGVCVHKKSISFYSF